MRINKYIAAATGLSRRAADKAIEEGRVEINGRLASVGDTANMEDTVKFDGQAVQPADTPTTLLFHKPAGYVCSRDGQGSQTVYDLLPSEYSQLKLVGRLDKDSSGLILLTDDGDLAQQLTHPSFQKTKIYLVALDKPLEPLHQQMISDYGVQLEDGISKLGLAKLGDEGKHWEITMSEGRNRQIRRTFEALGYQVVKLHRTNFGSYSLDGLQSGEWREVRD